MMKERAIEVELAPCGLRCGACVAFADGEIRAHAAALRELLGPSFGAYAERFEAMQPVFGNYAAFRELLDWLASGSCTGCRGAGCLFTACGVGPCAQERGVRFCFECEDFPCSEHGLPEGLAERWKSNNERMRSVGVEAFRESARDKPRYP